MDLDQVCEKTEKWIPIYNIVGPHESLGVVSPMAFLNDRSRGTPKMKASTDRILTTHVGSLPRVGGLAEMLVAKERGEQVDETTLAAAIRAGVRRVVAAQLEAGVDIGNDGEMPRTTFVDYISERIAGFAKAERGERPIPLDAQKFPIWFSNVEVSGRRRINVYEFSQAVDALKYDETLAGVRAECDELAACLGQSEVKFTEPFMTAVSPGFAATAMMNRHYDSHESYVFALARALRHEYEHIASHGYVLQIDAPDMGMERAGFFQDTSLALPITHKSQSA